jgi:hypothetical protein
VFFSKAKESQDSLKPGTLRLIPAEEQLASWKRDYVGMREMFFGKPPTFDEILRVIGNFERDFNSTEAS